jgi:hypothetical protein
MDTNPNGSAKTVAQAAESFMGLMGGEEAEQAQPEAASEEIIEDTVEQVEIQEDLEEDDAGEEYEEPEEAPTPTYRVKVGKEEIDVPLDELLNGYQRTADYTRKTQELAETRKAIEAEKGKVQEAARLRDQYAERLGVIEQMLSSQTEKAEDLAALKEVDPIGYAVKVAEQAEREKQMSAVRAERQRLALQQNAEQSERLKVHLANEAAKLREAIPEMADSARADVVKREIRDFAKSIGFSDQELAAVYDSRAVQTLYKAMQYDKLMKGKPGVTKKVNQAPKMLKPGTSTPEARETEQTKKLRQQLRKSGNKNDAAKLFERFL